jgi:pilus assembly protein CpaC
VTQSAASRHGLLLAILAAGTLAGAPADIATQIGATVGKSLVIDSAVNIQRVSVGDAALAEAVAVSPKELLINAKAPGETSVILWEQGGRRVAYTLTVQPNPAKLEAVREEIAKELPGQDMVVNLENDAVFLRGTAKDMVSAERAAAMAGTLGKVVNLLRVTVPPAEAQILLKVRFANVDRVAAQDLGMNLISTGALNTTGSVSTGQYSPPAVQTDGNIHTFSISDALNVFLFRPDLNLGALIRALESKRLLEILAEPNVLAINGKPASFVSGGEFPFPTLQGGGAGLGAVTIQFREFGVRIHFLPVVTPRGTVRLQVTPEVSSLDFANGLVFQGFNIPALATRRVQTEVELESGQSFVIAGLLDNRTVETWNKIPGISNIPLLGKLFQSRAVSKNSSELLVLITPELVRPIPAGQPLPVVERPVPFLGGEPGAAPRTPGMEVTGPVPVTPTQGTVPVEQLRKQEQPAPAAAAPPAVQFIPVPIAPPTQQPVNPGAAPPGSGDGDK